jgi:hypothetical protein
MSPSIHGCPGSSTIRAWLFGHQMGRVVSRDIRVPSGEGSDPHYSLSEAVEPRFALAAGGAGSRRGAPSCLTASVHLTRTETYPAAV